MRHFEEPQFVIVFYCKDYDCLSSEFDYTREDAIQIAKRAILQDLEKCRRRYPEFILNHATLGARIYDRLNRSNYFTMVRLISTLGEFVISREKKGSDNDF